jgi:hypothetical protein
MRWRQAAITLIDLGLLICGAAAIVIVLGGRGRLHVGELQISARSPFNALLGAGAFAALRLLFGRGYRPLPAFGVPDVRPILEERERFAAPEVFSRRVRQYAAAATLGSLVWIAPHMLHIRNIPDPGDPLFSAWRIARLAHQLVTDPRHLLDGNTFYPRPLTLTYSDATVLEGLAGAPFVLLGIDPLIVSNALTLLAFPACGLAFFWAAWRLTGDPQAALVAALVGAWYPFHAEHYSHLELQWCMFAPVAIVALLRALAAPGWRTGALFGASVAAQWLASMYIGVMLMCFLVPFGMIMIAAWRVTPSRAVLRAAGGLAIVLLPAIVALGLPYMSSRAARGERSRYDVSFGSAEPSDYGKAHFRLASYQWLSREGHVGERELFPGTSTLVLAAVGVLPPLTGAATATLVAGAATFDWSLGLRGLTYDDLYKRSVVIRGMRMPARFSVLVGAALALLGAYGARRIIALGRTARQRGAICAVLALIVLFDLRVDPHLEPYASKIPGIYQSVTPDMVLMEMPRDRDRADRFFAPAYMYFSTKHWAHLLGGYSGFMPNEPDFDDAVRSFPHPDAVARFRLMGATHLTYNCSFDWIGCKDVMAALAANPTLQLVITSTWRAQPVALYRFR